jgi:hypothetical protein
MRFAIVAPRNVRTVAGPMTRVAVASYVDETTGARVALTFDTERDAMRALFGVDGEPDAAALDGRTRARLTVVSMSTVHASARIIARANGTHRARVAPSDVRPSHPDAIARAAAIDARLHARSVALVPVAR